MKKKAVSLVTNKENSPPQARMFGDLTSLACSNALLQKKRKKKVRSKKTEKKEQEKKGCCFVLFFT